MQIKKRIFPYPILNNFKSISNFGESSFNFKYEVEDNENSYLLKNVSYECNCESLNNLITNNLVKVVLIIECSNTVFRETYEITSVPKDIKLNKGDFDGRVFCSIFAYAKQDFSYSPHDVDDDYKDINFAIEKYCILAANDGFYITFSHPEDEENLRSSIFAIDVDSTKNENAPFTVDCDTERKIAIYLSTKDFNNYKIIHTNLAYKEVFFTMILVPSLIQALMMIRGELENGDDFDSIIENHLWFSSILKAYERQFSKQLDKETLMDATGPIIIAQKLLGLPLEKALDNLTNKIKEDMGGEANV